MTHLEVKKASKAAAVLTICIAALNLTGWLCSVEALTFPVAGHASMKAITALCMIVLALSVLIVERAKLLSQVLSGLVVVFGLLSLAEHLLNCNLGIDNLIAKDSGFQLAGALPGQMAFNTAFSLVLLGLSVGFLQYWKKGQVISCFFALTTLASGFFTFLLHLYSVPHLSSVQNFTQMALATASCFIFLSISALCAHPEHDPVALVISNTAGGYAARRLLSLSVFLPMGLGWLTLVGQDHLHYPFEFSLSLLVLSMVVLLSALIWWVSNTLSREDAGRKLAEALSISEAKYRTVMDTATDAIFSTDQNGHFIFANNASAILFGYTPEQLIGQELSLIIKSFPDDAFLRPSSHLGVPVIGHRRDGSTFPIELSVGPGTEANQFSITYIARDITRRKKAEEDLRENQDMTQAILQSADDAFVSIDGNDGIIDWNAQACKIFGWTREEILGRPLGETILPPDYRQTHLERLHKYLVSGEERTNQRIEIRALNKSGREFPVEVSIFPVKLNTRLVLCAFIRDITDRKNSELTLQMARDQAIETSRFKSDFVANISHEIRTPMNGILGMTEMMLRTDLTKRQFGYATTVQEAGKALLSVINDVLDFSKIEAGKLCIETADFDLIRLVESVAELLAAPARDKSLSIHTYIEPKIPRMMRGDAGRLRQILMNLAGNAIKFSHEGEVIIRVTYDDSRPGRVKFLISDCGIGLSEDECKVLFQPYVQIGGNMAQTGTGLGLSISKRLVELMKGEIGVESVKGEGANFWFSIPLLNGAAIDTQLSERAGLSGVRVLIVDEENVTREVLAQYCTCWGMKAEVATSAEQAVDKLSRFDADDPYTFVLTALVLPGMGGLEFGKYIKRNLIYADLRLLLITDSDQPDIGELAVKLGFDAYFTKPLKQSQLLDCLINVLAESISEKNQQQSAIDLEITQPTTIPPRMRDQLILVVDDHPVNQEVALLLLQSIGFETHIAENGKKALEMMKNVPYSLVFMDCQMPEMDGFDTTRELRKIEARTGKHLPVVAMTAHAIEGSRDHCISAGMDDFMSKPIDSQRLLDVFAKWLPEAAISRESAPVAGKKS